MRLEVLVEIVVQGYDEKQIRQIMEDLVPYQNDHEVCAALSHYFRRADMFVVVEQSRARRLVVQQAEEVLSDKTTWVLFMENLVRTYHYTAWYLAMKANQWLKEEPLQILIRDHPPLAEVGRIVDLLSAAKPYEVVRLKERLESGETLFTMTNRYFVRYERTALPHLNKP